METLPRKNSTANWHILTFFLVLIILMFYGLWTGNDLLTARHVGLGLLGYFILSFVIRIVLIVFQAKKNRQPVR